jgi:hypothetical protein
LLDDYMDGTLLVACRFSMFYVFTRSTCSSSAAPHDQWFTTHVHPSWKVRQVKVWLLTKAHSVSSSHPRHRSSQSSIAFVHDSTHRPLSPITFAAASPLSPDSAHQIPNDRLADPRNEDSTADEPEPSGVSSSRRQSLVLKSSRSSNLRSQSPPHSGPSSGSATRFESKLDSGKLSASSPYSPKNMSIVRFSTGQVLEDDFTMSWYDIKPHELLEIHRTGIILRLPRHDLSAYVQPYWEGWVKSLRVIYKPSGSVIKSVEDARAQSGRTSSNKKPAKEAPQLEWKDRWVVISDGMLSLCKDHSVRLISLPPFQHLMHHRTMFLLKSYSCPH